jgi:ribosomal-protein-alanine N-acetyltransferase
MFGRRPKVIARGEQVHLITPSKEQEDEFVAMTTASRAFHEPWVYPATDERRYRAYLDRLERGGAFGFLVYRNEDASLAGVININDVVMGGFRCGSLGYYGAAMFAGRGYMTEGLALVLDHAFTALELHRLEANVQPANANSLGLIKRLGFRQEGFSPAFLKIGGVWCDHERWAILAEEWLSAHGTRSPEPHATILA